MTTPSATPACFPGSLCHDCAAPPRYVVSDRGSTFIYCPVFKRYPPQPVASCAEFKPQSASGSL